MLIEMNEMQLDEVNGGIAPAVILAYGLATYLAAKGVEAIVNAAKGNSSSTNTTSTTISNSATTCK